MTQPVDYSGTCHTKDAVPGQPPGTCKAQIFVCSTGSSDDNVVVKAAKPLWA